MSDFHDTYRGRYRPSGRVDVPRFATFGAGVACAAAAYAWLLWQGFEHRVYTPLVFILGGAMIVSGLSLLAVRLGHCRSPAAGLLLGLAAGWILQPGHHALPYLLDLEPGATADGAGFVRHLDRRLSEVQMSWGATPHIEDLEPGETARGDYLFLWAATALEAVFIPLLCALPPLLRVLRDPYCEAGGEWARRIRLAFYPGADQVLRQALEEGRVAEVAAEVLMEHHPNQPAVIGLLDVCSMPGSDGVAGFLSLKISRGEASAAIVMESIFPYYRLRPRCAALTAAEVAALRALTPERATRQVAPSRLEAPETGVASGELARLESVEPSSLAAADRRAGQLAELINLAPLLACAAVGLGLLLAAVDVEDDAGPLANVLGVSGIVLMLTGAWLAVMDQHMVGDRYLLRRLFRRLADRPGLLVRPEDRDAIPVKLVPRRAWSGGADELIDHGLLAVRDAVLYEGNRQRLRIPAASVQALYLDSLSVDQYQALHFAVLEVRAADGLHTLPFLRMAPPLGEALFRSKARRAKVLFERLAVLVEEELGSA